MIINYSVIIPHYNIPELLVRCINSIPVRPDVQVIVVDDCSPGAEEYIIKYKELSRPYLEFYSTGKGGSAGRARNVGLDHAKGKWLVFADSDDFFVENIGELFDEYVNAEEDIIYFNNKSVLSDNINQSSERDLRSWMFERFSRTKDESIFRCDCPTPWGRFTKKELVDRINARFDETRYSNDRFFDVYTGINAHNIRIVDSLCYILTQRTNSLTSNYCSTYKEWKIRYEVAQRVQDIVDSSQYTMTLGTIPWYMGTLWHNHRSKYPVELIRLLSRPIYFLKVVKQLIRDISNS